jgi:hypothetical protein
MILFDDTAVLYINNWDTNNVNKLNDGNENTGQIKSMDTSYIQIASH